MNEFDKTARNIIIMLAMFFLILLIFGFFVRDIEFLNQAFGQVSFLVYAVSIAYGIAFSIIKVILIKRSLVKVVKLGQNNESKANMVSFRNFIFRYLLTGGILYISIVSNKLDLFGALLGVLALQPASYLAGFLLKRDALNNEIDEDTNSFR